MSSINLSITRKQKSFIEATQTEVLFGGAAGGGKSYGQMVDAFLFALKYAGSKQLILRRTFAELDKSIIRTVLSLYPREVFTFNSSSHTGRFRNGSVIDFGYCATENDVYQYQSAEYDVIRFDELTHFTEAQYVYLISRIRGVNNFPKQIKSSTNPGSVGHSWVKARFVDPAPENTPFTAPDGMTRIFIPSKVDDNKFLMRDDPSYKERLLALPEKDRKALLYGDWNIFEGQYFDEFDPTVHVIQPFQIPREWRIYRALDYGLDRLACIWVAVDSTGCHYVFKEKCESNLPIAEAAKAVITHTNPDEEIYTTLAPPDLWGRSQETGKGKADIFYANGLRLTKASNDREAGWLAIKELLRKDANGESRLKIFSTCRELIKCLPMLVRDPKRPTDCLTEPHEITHAPDALRYYAISWARPNDPKEMKRIRYTEDQLEDLYNARSEAEREAIYRKYGGKPL